MTAATRRPAAASSATGNIYDLGYQGYDGPRLGRRHAVAALFSNSLRSTFGIGRGGRAKIIPMGLTVLAVLPALVALAVTGLGRQLGGGGGPIELITYATYYSNIGQFLFLFVAAQAPELLGRDLRSGVLSLYFSRSLRRYDYALAKLGALVAALLIVQLLPQLLLFIGRILSSTDIIGAIGDDLPSLGPVLAQAILAAVLLASLGLVVAAFAARRAYATGGIIALFLVPPIVAAVVYDLARGSQRSLALVLSPPDLLETTNGWLFDGLTGGRRGLDGSLALAAAIVIAAIAIGLMIRRYQRMPT